MKNWENAVLEELDIKDTMMGGPLSEEVDDQWIDNNQAYRSYPKQGS